MKMDKYLSTNNSNKYLFVEAGVKPQDIKFPDDIDVDFMELQFLNTTPDLITGDSPIQGFELDRVISEVKNNGYSLLTFNASK